MASNGVVTEPQAELSFLQSTTLTYSVRLDDVLEGVDRVDVIKLDIEGGEYRALDGARNLLKKHRPVVFSEFSPPALKVISGVDPESYLELLLIDKDYRIDVLESSGSVIHCERTIRKVMECFQVAACDHIDIVARPADK